MLFESIREEVGPGRGKGSWTEALFECSKCRDITEHRHYANRLECRVCNKKAYNVTASHDGEQKMDTLNKKHNAWPTAEECGWNSGKGS